MRYSSTALVATAMTLVASPALAESVRFEIIPDAISADVNRDCEIDIVDLLALLSNWGDCP